MCLTFPYQIIRFEDQVTAIAHDLKKQEKRVTISALVDIQIGDWVLVNANLAMQKIPADEALELIKLLKQN